MVRSLIWAGEKQRQCIGLRNPFGAEGDAQSRSITLDRDSCQPAQRDGIGQPGAEIESRVGASQRMAQVATRQHVAGPDDSGFIDSMDLSAPLRTRHQHGLRMGLLQSLPDLLEAAIVVALVRGVDQRDGPF